jgi:hypothetical protein
LLFFGGAKVNSTSDEDLKKLDEALKSKDIAKIK